MQLGDPSASARRVSEDCDQIGERAARANRRKLTRVAAKDQPVHTAKRIDRRTKHLLGEHRRLVNHDGLGAGEALRLWCEVVAATVIVPALVLAKELRERPCWLLRSRC